MFRKAIAIALVFVMVIVGSVAGTMAYLQDQDSDVNVMTLGNVSIEQLEYQRVVKDDGTYEMVTSDKYGEGYKIEEFEQNKPLYPAVGTVTGWGNAVYFDQLGAGASGGQKVLDGIENVQDKFVLVKNTGKNAAYVRTLIAYEMGSLSYDEWNELVMISVGDNWEDTNVAAIKVEDSTYYVVEYVYTGNADRHTNGILPAGHYTYNSLAQIYLKPEAENEDMEAIDGNENGLYDILVLSQAVQVDGFGDAATALNTAFEEATADNVAEWFKGVIDDNGADTWDGTADTSWYNDTDTEFEITTAEELAGLAELVDEGNTFEGKTVKVGKDIDLKYVPEGSTEPKSFDPIGDKSAFAGTFDGQGHTIENLYQSGWAFGYEWGSYGSIGLFGELKSATVKNLTLSGAESLVEGGDVGGITGSATGTCVFENITIEDSVFATYNNGNGGIIGWSGAGNYTFKNITIGEDVVLAGLWGSFDSSIGGIVGQGEPGAIYNFENVDIACRLDVYNDCTASYDYYNYRMCGMIIGRLQETTTIDGTNYPDTSKYNINCNNVTVTYGDWYNYHYCEPTPAGMNGGRGMRVEPGYSYGGLPADYDHSQCVDNHMNLIPFDQIFGGAQYGVKGLKTYTGVTVVYP